MYPVVVDTVLTPMQQTTIEAVDEGDEVEFEYTTKLMNNRVSKSGEVVEASGDVVKVNIDDTDPFEGDSDVFILLGDPEKLKDVFYERSGERDQFVGDRARII